MIDRVRLCATDVEFPFVRLSVNAASVGESSGTEKRGGGGGVREREKEGLAEEKRVVLVFKNPPKVKLPRAREVPGSRWTVDRSWVSLLRVDDAERARSLHFQQG